MTPIHTWADPRAQRALAVLRQMIAITGHRAHGAAQDITMRRLRFPDVRLVLTIHVARSDDPDEAVACHDSITVNLLSLAIAEHPAQEVAETVAQLRRRLRVQLQNHFREALLAPGTEKAAAHQRNRP